MTKFLKRVAIFLVLLLVILLVFVTNYIYQRNIKNSNYLGIETVILGDSHTQNGLNDQMLPHCGNLSSSGESYFYSFIKLRKLLEINKGIKTVVLSYGEHNLSLQVEQKWLLDDENIKSKFGTLFPFMQWEDIVFLLESKSYNISPLLIKASVYYSIYSAERQLLGKGLPFIGGYTPNTKCLQDSNLVSKNHEIDSYDIANFQLEYLDKIYRLCKAEDIQLVLVNTPVFKGQKEFLNLKKYVKEDVTYLDFHQLDLDMTFFSDKNHLNPKGASYLTNLVKKELF